MTASDADLDEVIREMFADRDPVREWLEARRAVEEAPPPEPCIIPMPDFPRDRRRFSGLVRYRCTVPGGGCLWTYDVDALEEDSEPLTFPVSGSLDDLTRHISERADRRVKRIREEIETAFRKHYAERHPGQEPPDQHHAAGVSPEGAPAARLP